MRWIGVSVLLVAGIAAVLTTLRGRRLTDGAALGSVSARWVASHRIDVP